MIVSVILCIICIHFEILIIRIDFLDIFANHAYYNRILKHVRFDMARTLFYLLAAYLSGSILYAYIWGRIISHKDITEGTRDHNPGAANAFMQSGILCGSLTLLCDILKGFFPVWLFLRHVNYRDFELALVMAAPVIGHVFSLFYHFHGGKGIAVSFGCLLGLYPYITPVLTLAACFIIYSTILVISPHYYRTLVTYITTALISFFTIKISAIRWGTLLISGTIVGKLLICDEKREACKVKLL